MAYIFAAVSTRHTNTCMGVPVLSQWTVFMGTKAKSKRSKWMSLFMVLGVPSIITVIVWNITKDNLSLWRDATKPTMCQHCTHRCPKELRPWEIFSLTNASAQKDAPSFTEDWNNFYACAQYLPTKSKSVRAIMHFLRLQFAIHA